MKVLETPDDAAPMIAETSCESRSVTETVAMSVVASPESRKSTSTVMPAAGVVDLVGAELDAGLLGRAEERERAGLGKDRAELEVDRSRSPASMGRASPAARAGDLPTRPEACAPVLHAERRRALTPAMATPVQAARASAWPWPSRIRSCCSLGLKDWYTNAAPGDAVVFDSIAAPMAETSHPGHNRVTPT